MILDSVTKSLELLLGAAATANAMPVVVDYVDMTTTTTLSGSSDTQSNGTTVVTILAAPAASTQRKVNSISVYNADTVSSTVTIRLNNNTTLRNLISVTLQVGDTIGFTDVNGWYLLDSNGNLKSVQAASATAIATAIHNATNKTTPVGADEVGIWDSVSGLLNRVSFTNMLNWFAAKLGNASNVFSVAPATAAAHAVRSDQLSTDNTNFPIYTPPTSFATTLSSASGSFANASATMSVISIGKFRDVSFTIAIVDNGTAAGDIRLTIPAAAASNSNGVHREDAVTGNCGVVTASNGSASVILRTFTNGYPGATGYTIRGSISYYAA
jgi:hypothetical protein